MECNGAIMQEGMEVANKGLSEIRGSNSKMVVEPTRDQFASQQHIADIPKGGHSSMRFMLVHRRFVILCLPQMCFLFTPPRNIVNDLPPNVKLPTHLAYLELFQLLTPAPDPNHCMYKVSWLSVQLNTQPSSSKFMRYYTGTSTCIPSWNSHPAQLDQ
jgi:hypothetical protein